MQQTLTFFEQLPFEDLDDDIPKYNKIAETVQYTANPTIPIPQLKSSISIDGELYKVMDIVYYRNSMDIDFYLIKI